MSPEKNETRLSLRLRRILILLPYAIRHPGVRLVDLSDRFGVDQEDLMEDLNLVFLCGLPGYGPGDLIDVAIDDDDRVFIRMADYFAAPLRLTPAEALTLYAGGLRLAELPDMAGAEALKEALRKLGRALGMDEDEPPGIEVAPAAGPEGHLRTVRAALAARKRLRLTYWSASKQVESEREIDPWGLVASMGNWYLIAEDALSGEERMFRLDRIRDAAPLDEPATVPDDFEPGNYVTAWSGRTPAASFRFEISPDVARWFGEYNPTAKIEDLPDGWQRVEMPMSGEAWAVSLLLKLGRDVRSIDPPEIADAVRELARTLVEAHTG